MGRPAGSKNKAGEAQGVESAKEVSPEFTPVTEMKIEAIEPLKMPLKKGDAFLVNVNGADIYWTRSVLDIAYKRKSHEIVIPKGSSYVSPTGAKACTNCG